MTAHKPKAASRAYTIRGTRQEKPNKYALKKSVNQEMRTRRCICCLNERKTSYPVCGSCITENHKNDKKG